MTPVEAGRLSARLGTRLLSRVLNEVLPQEALETLKRRPTPQAQEVAGNLKQPLPTPELLEYPSGTAGALMVSQYPTVRLQDFAGSAQHSLRSLERVRYQFTHVFVLEEDGRLAGQVNIIDLALAEVGTPVRDVVSPVEAYVTVATSSEECARLRRHYNLTQLPVVDDDRLIGAIPAEFLLSAMVENDTRQMLQVASVAGEAANVNDHETPVVCRFQPFPELFVYRPPDGHCIYTHVVIPDGHRVYATFLAPVWVEQVQPKRPLRGPNRPASPAAASAGPGRCWRGRCSIRRAHHHEIARVLKKMSSAFPLYIADHTDLRAVPKGPHHLLLIFNAKLDVQRNWATIEFVQYYRLAIKLLF